MILTQSTRLLLCRHLVEYDFLRAVQLMIMPHAHAAPHGLIMAPLNGTSLFLCSVRHAYSALHRGLLAAFDLAPLARGPVLRARPGRRHAFGASGVGARLAPRAVGDAQASLHHVIVTVGVRALLYGLIWVHGTCGCRPRLRRGY